MPFHAWNPYIAYEKDNLKPLKQQEENLLSKKEVIPSQVNTKLDMLGSMVSKQVTLQSNTGGGLLSLREQLSPREPIVLSREQLQEYSSVTLNNIIKSGEKEKAMKLIDTEINSITGNPFIEEASKKKKLAILNTLKIAVGDDMFFKTVKMQAGELWRNMWGDDSRNHDTFIQAVRTGLEGSIHTGTIQVIKFNKSEGYNTVSIMQLRDEITQDVNSTNVTAFRSIFSLGNDWQKTLVEMLGQDAIAKVGIYLKGRYWNSRLINNLPNKNEVKAFFEESATRYTNKQSELIQDVYQKFSVDGIFDIQNIQENFPTLLSKIELDKLPSLRKNPPKITELHDDLWRLKVSYKQMETYLDAFEMDNRLLETRAKKRRDELLKTRDTWDIGDFIRKIPGVDTKVIQRFEGKRYPIKNQSTEQMKELFALLAPYKDTIPKELESRFTLLFQNLSIIDDVKKTHEIAGGVRATKVTIAENKQQKGADSLVQPLSESEKRIIESAGKLNAAQEEKIFIIHQTETTDALTNLLSSLGCKDMAELSQSNDKLEQAIRILRDKTNRTLEEQNLLETLIGIYGNSRTIDVSIAEIARNSHTLEKTEKYISAATGGTSISRKQIEETLLRELQAEPSSEKAYGTKIYQMKSGDSMSVKELPEFQKSLISDYAIMVSSEGDWTRTIKDNNGETILNDVPMTSVESVLTELKLLNELGFGPLEKHLPTLNTLLSHTLEGYHIDSYDGEFGKYESIKLLSMLTKLLYPEEDMTRFIDMRDYLRFYRTITQNKSSHPERKMRDLGILNENNEFMIGRFQEILGMKE